MRSAAHAVGRAQNPLAPETPEALLTSPPSKEWTTRPESTSRWTLLAAGALFGLGLLARLIFIGDCRFAGDEARFYGEARTLVDEGRIPALGTSVTGGQARLPGGTFSILMAVPQLFSRSPMACNVAIVLLNMLAYALLALTVQRWMGPKTALLFSIAVLFSPWSYFFSDRIWNPNLLILILAACLWSFTRMLDRPGSRQSFWLTLGLVVVPQFHLSGVLLWVLMAVLLAVYRPKINARAALAGLLVGVLCYAPYLLAEFQSGFDNTRALLNMPSDPQYSWRSIARVPLNLLLLATGEMGYLVQQGFWFPYREWHFYLTGHGWQTMRELFGQGGWTLGPVVYLALEVALVAMAWLLGGFKLLSLGRHAWRHVRHNPLRLAFGVTLLLAPLAIWLMHKSYHPHYIYLLYPLTFVPLLGLYRKIGESRGFALLLVWVLLGAVVHTMASARLYETAERRYSLAEQQAAMGYIFDTAQDSPFALEVHFRHSHWTPDSMQVLSRHYFRRPFRQQFQAPIRYMLYDKDTGFRLASPGRTHLGGYRIGGYRAFRASVMFKTERGPAP